ncbi:MAG: YdcF family protein [Desulfuromonadaceae bacterium]|nr:YdcF family protein [Desulfuromonadaceae bacterium]
MIPPGLFIVCALVFSVYFVLRKQPRFASISIIFALAIWGCSISPVTDNIMLPLESGVAIPDTISGDVIILLSAGSYDAVPDLTGTGMPDEDMLGRLITAARLYRILQVPVIVSGGVPPGEKAPKAAAAGRILIDLGIPRDKLIIEDRSANTLENAGNSSTVCRQRNFKRPILVTSAYHIKRSIMAFNKFGMHVLPVPANFRNGHRQEYGWSSFLASADALETAQRALREFVALGYYKYVLSL